VDRLAALGVNIVHDASLHALLDGAAHREIALGLGLAGLAIVGVGLARSRALGVKPTVLPKSQAARIVANPIPGKWESGLGSLLLDNAYLLGLGGRLALNANGGNVKETDSLIGAEIVASSTGLNGTLDRLLDGINHQAVHLLSDEEGTVVLHGRGHF
jgi:hypothetical protein